jgi:predicted ATPase
VITSLEIDNFKSLLEFKLPLAKFNCLVGLNGAGKSTVLQAIDFISQLMKGDVSGWLESRNWENSDLNSKLTKKSNIEFELVFNLDGKVINWFGSFNRTTLRCTKEYIKQGSNYLMTVNDGRYSLKPRINPSQEIIFDYQGSILSVLKDNQLNETILAIKHNVLNIHSLDLISPELLRTRNRKADGKLGLGGQNLSAFIHEAGENIQKAITKKLQEMYGQLDSLEVKSLRSGWKQLEIVENFDGQKITSLARHVNDGMLRLMAILSQLEIPNAFLLFDEIENGINPELVEFLIDMLVKSDDQILITTHSPLVLNFLDDDVAKQGVIYLYKQSNGRTKAIRLFDIPSMNKKLEFMGVGEAFIDTNLTELYREVEESSKLETEQQG